jgi:hypothetical protein
MRSPGSILFSLLLPLIFAAGLFFLGRLFIRRPEVSTKFFTFSMNPKSRFGAVASKCIGYFFCVGAIIYVVLIPLYLVILFHQTR